MAIRAVVFDIGGVLENTPDLGVRAAWEARLGLEPGGLDRRLDGVWRGGGVGALTEEEVHARVGEILGIGAARVDAFMADVWREYLGTLNVELVEYFRGLRPRFRTGIVSNSFVGARRREQELYGFEELCDVIVYSHEVGVSKPDRRVYALACERLGVAPGEVVFLDDWEPAVEGARASGMQGVLFRDNARAIAEIEACIQRDG